MTLLSVNVQERNNGFFLLVATGEVFLLNECMPYLTHFIHQNNYRFSPLYIPGDSILERSTATWSVVHTAGWQ